jgi:hypothetical protein
MQAIIIELDARDRFSCRRHPPRVGLTLILAGSARVRNDGCCRSSLRREEHVKRAANFIRLQPKVPAVISRDGL